MISKSSQGVQGLKGRIDRTWLQMHSSYGELIAKASTSGPLAFFLSTQEDSSGEEGYLYLRDVYEENSFFFWVDYSFITQHFFPVAGTVFRHRQSRWLPRAAEAELRARWRQFWTSQQRPRLCPAYAGSRQQRLPPGTAASEVWMK